MEQIGKGNTQISIILPTYNESQNIISLLKSISQNIPKNLRIQTIVVDDNSPDKTGKIVEEYLYNLKKLANHSIDVIHRKTKDGLSSAILHGIESAKGEHIIVMDSDFSHPPQIIPKMLEYLKKYHYDIVVASRYTKGGGIRNWSLKRKLMSKFATSMAKNLLDIETNDPLSGCFGFKKNIIKDLKFDAIGFKILLELLVKSDSRKIIEIPYTFTDRKFGSSKLDARIMIDYVKSIWKLYRFGQESTKEKSRSVRFFSKAARFFTVGASGMLINYVVSLFSSVLHPEIWFLHANMMGIILSMTSNFILNKHWTFEDRDWSFKKTLKQYGKFIGLSSIGALIQLSMVFHFVDVQDFQYPTALLLAVMLAAVGNFIFNKKWTFNQKIWS